MYENGQRWTIKPLKPLFLLGFKDVIGWFWTSNWWRRGELNPRPSIRHCRRYMLSTLYLFSHKQPKGQDVIGEFS